LFIKDITLRVGPEKYILEYQEKIKEETLLLMVLVLAIGGKYAFRTHP